MNHKIKVKCTCMCHHVPGIVHFKACCKNGYVELDINDLDKDDKDS